MNPILKPEEQAVFALRKLYQNFGYTPYKMSRFEEYDLYVRNKDFMQSQLVITFADRSGKLLALKPDVTLSIIKNAPDEAGCVQKMYYNESVYRDDPATHTMKEIMQCGLECVGDLGSYEIAEVLLLAAAFYFIHFHRHRASLRKKLQYIIYHFPCFYKYQKEIPSRPLFLSLNGAYAAAFFRAGIVHRPLLAFLSYIW